MKKFFLGLFLLVILLVAILLINTLRMSSKQVDGEPVEKVAISDQVFENLSKAIQFKTISFNEDTPPDSAEFFGFHSFLEETFPLIHSKLKLEKINTYSLLYTWEGSDPSMKPIILMSHQDVVPVDEPTINQWEAPPFEGRITDTHIIGRGTMDDKGTLMGLLESVEKLLSEGFQPTRTIYIASGHDEEVGGPRGAGKIAELLKERGIKAAMTMDEGGFIAEGLVPGVKSPVAMINLGEKGFASFRLIVKTNGGHSSAPPKENTIGILAKAIVDLENNQLPYKMIDPIPQQLEYLGPEMPFFIRMVFANPWLFKKQILEGLNIHTTTAPTIIDGGVKNNVIPTVAEATINFRILPGETIESTQAHIKSIVSDKVQVEPVGFLTNPPPVSSADAEPYKILEKTMRSLHPETVVVPGLVGGATDSRYFYPVSEQVYRFHPMRLDSTSMQRFHGIDEKLGKENYKEIIQFCYQLIKNFN
ncbi:M20 family peptidase [Algoriphagus mannitolivorans]|uniref:M20 family peptidase n=1 Tax=Algoriphagus mannitolivorans TaxID=226504 RepID=UPI00047D33B1|nr:M20 family peptidase [Algoriphagus mannitolivorans]